MGKYEKLLTKILRGTSEANIDFNSLCQLLIKLGFNQRIKGDHFIFIKEGIEEIINIQPLNSKAKAYQVKQIRNLIIKYKLGDNDVN